MRCSLLILLSLAVIGAAVFFAAFQLSDRLCTSRRAVNVDDLDWLRLEFKLSNAQLSRIRTLHEGYLPSCREYCEQIATRQRELSVALARGKPVGPQAERLLREIGEIRARCQADMLRHFAAVAAVMPTAQGARYLSEMQRLTLGSHATIEDSMATDVSDAHAHHGN